MLNQAGKVRLVIQGLAIGERGSAAAAHCLGVRRGGRLGRCRG